jgi:proline iminopeptidase
LHLLVAHPERLLGAVCIDPLGAFAEVLGEYGENLLRSRPPAHAARMEELERRRRTGEGTEDEAPKSLALTWPSWFSDPARPPPFPFDHYGVDRSTGTNASISEHFEGGTLERGLPRAGLPVLFVHGERDPLPLRTATDTAALIAGARVAVVEGAGHLPWFERPAAVREAVEDFIYG